MHTLDFERITAEKLGGLAWVLDELEERLRETDRLEPPGNASRRSAGSSPPRVSSRCGPPTCSTAASPRAPPRRWRSSPGARLAQRLAREGGRAARAGRAGGRAPVARRSRAASAALYRAAVGSTISGGSAEILQVVIARRGLGLSVSAAARGRARRRVRAVRRRAALRRAARRSRRRRRQGRAARAGTGIATSCRSRPASAATSSRSTAGSARSSSTSRPTEGLRDELAASSQRRHRAAQLPAASGPRGSGSTGRPCTRRMPALVVGRVELVRRGGAARRRAGVRPRRAGARGAPDGARLAGRRRAGAGGRDPDGRPHGRLPARDGRARRARASAGDGRGRARRGLAARRRARGAAPGSRLARGEARAPRARRPRAARRPSRRDRGRRRDEPVLPLLRGRPTGSSRSRASTSCSAGRSSRCSGSTTRPIDAPDVVPEDDERPRREGGADRGDRARVRRGDGRDVARAARVRRRAVRLGAAARGRPRRPAGRRASSSSGGSPSPVSGRSTCSRRSSAPAGNDRRRARLLRSVPTPRPSSAELA